MGVGCEVRLGHIVMRSGCEIWMENINKEKI